MARRTGGRWAAWEGQGPWDWEGSLCAEARPPQVTPPSWSFGKVCRAWSWAPPATSTPGRLSSSPRCPGNGGRRLKSQGPRLGVEEASVEREGGRGSRGGQGGEEGDLGPMWRGLSGGERQALAQKGQAGWLQALPSGWLLLRGLPLLCGRGWRWQL